MVVGDLGELGDAVDEGDRGGEVGELEVALDLRALRPAASPPASPGARRSRHRRAAPSAPSLPRGATASYSPSCASSASSPTRPSCCSRSASDDEVVGVTHECDYPPPRPGAAGRSRATCCRRGLSAGEIDAAVRERTLDGESIYELDRDGARGARARPDRHAGAVPGLRGLLRRGGRARQGAALAPAGDRARPEDARRDARRRAHARGGDRAPRAWRRARRPIGGRGSTACGSPCAGLRAPARGGARVARPRLRRGPLDAAADRARRRRGRARPARRALQDGLAGRRSRRPSPRSSS